VPEGTRIVGRYEIVGRIGKGGMGVVHLARQPGLDRLVALKELVAVDADDPSFAERFVREARVAGALSHPNIVTVFDYFEEEGTAFIAMEYLERGSLQPLVGRLTFTQILGVLEGVFAGLGHAHEEGVIHRDLKPGNLLVARRGTIKIADFGIAKALNLLGTQSLTGTGVAVGSPTYMAPEQALAGEIGPSTDLYSLGVVAYELLVGRVPFGATDTPMAILWKHVHEPVPPPLSLNPRLDPRVAAWLERLLAKQPGERPQSAAEAWDELEEVAVEALGERWRREAALPAGAGDEAVVPAMPVAAPATPAAGDAPPPDRQPRRRRRWILVALSLALVAAAVAGVLALVTGGSSSSTITERFSAVSGGWFPSYHEAEADGSVKDGAYLVRIKTVDGFRVVAHDFDPRAKGRLVRTSSLPPGGARLAVDESKVAGADSAAGLSCRGNGPESDASYYYLGVSGDGQAFIERYSDGETHTLREWRRSPAVRTGNATNHLVGECLGGRDGGPVRLSLRVNGSEVARATDPDGFPISFYGFFAGAHEPGLAVRFDNFSLDRL
jgi:predicted Ser/Thr protein kinase